MTVDPKELFRNHFAFLVGIDKYRHFRDLQGARGDAETLSDALRSVGYSAKNIYLVTPEEISLSDLQRQVEDFLTQVKVTRQGDSNPHIIVFWAGHGVPTGDGSCLVASTTRYDLENLYQLAIPLKVLVGRLKEVWPASLTMFFDVCHSIQQDLGEPAQQHVFGPMRAAVKQNPRWAFVGVSTFAYEAPIRRDQGRTEWAGILADAVQAGVRGEPCDRHDRQPCSAEDCVVSVELLVPKLELAVTRKATAATDDTQRLYVDGSLDSRRAHESPTAIGLAVRRFAEARLDEEALPAKADLLARTVVNNVGHV